MNPEEGGYYVLLADIYASASKRNKLAEVKKSNIIKKQWLKKTPGCSSVELRNDVHFLYSSTTHPQFKRTYVLNLGNEIKTASYVPDTNLINNVEGDVQEQLLDSHSKQLAVAFGHLNTSPGTTILVRKIRKGKTKGRSFRGHWN